MDNIKRVYEEGKNKKKPSLIEKQGDQDCSDSEILVRAGFFPISHPTFRPPTKMAKIGSYPLVVGCFPAG